MRFFARLVLTCCLSYMSACAQVSPWERNILAQDGMQLTPDALEAYAKQHVYFSKEAATGGEGIGGGGCGCN